MKRVHRELPREQIETLRRDLEARAAAGDADIGGMIRDMRLVLRMSQAEYARTCNVALRVLSQIEAGEGNPGFKTVGRLLAPFGFRLGVIEGSGGAPAPPPVPKPAGTPIVLAMSACAGGRRSPRPEDHAMAVACAILVPERGLPLLDACVEPLVSRDRGAEDVLAGLLRLEPALLYAALRLSPLREGATPGEMEQAAVGDESHLMSMLLQRLVAFGQETGHRFTLGIGRPWRSADDAKLPQASMYRRLSQHTLLKIKASPKAARPAQMAGLDFYMPGNPRLAAAEAVADALLQHLRGIHGDVDLDGRAAVDGWMLGRLVEQV